MHKQPLLSDAALVHIIKILIAIIPDFMGIFNCLIFWILAITWSPINVVRYLFADCGCTTHLEVSFWEAFYSFLWWADEVRFSLHRHFFSIRLYIHRILFYHFIRYLCVAVTLFLKFLPHIFNYFWKFLDFVDMQLWVGILS